MNAAKKSGRKQAQAPVLAIINGEIDDELSLFSPRLVMDDVAVALCAEPLQCVVAGNDEVR